jgi:potassium channel subfamily K
MMVFVSNDAKESLLPDMKDRSHLNEKNALKRRRINGVESPLPLESINVKQQFYIKHVVFLLAAYLGGGTLCFFLIRNQIRGQKTNGILDPIYLCVVIMTIIGNGDLVLDNVLVKLACIYVFIDMALVGLFLSQAADYMIEKQEILVVRDIYMSGKVSLNEILKEVETNKVKYKFIMVGVLLLVLIVVGTVFLFLVEELNFMDAFYCVCTTIILK